MFKVRIGYSLSDDKKPLIIRLNAWVQYMIRSFAIIIFEPSLVEVPALEIGSSYTVICMK